MIPQISIIIPVYNAEKYLRDCLDSIIAQSFTNYEVILVNDGSTDNSGKICEDYEKKDHRFILVNQRNHGVSYARNTGLNIARAKLVFFSDADDWLSENALEVLYDEYIKTGSDMIIANMAFVYKGHWQLVKVFDSAFTSNEKEFITQYERACIGYGYNPKPGATRKSAGLGSMGNKLYLRDIIERYNLRFDLEIFGIYEDNLFVLHYLEHCSSISYITDCVYYYRKVSNSNSRGYKPNTLEINQRIFDKIDAYINTYKSSRREEFNKAFYMYVIRRLEVSLSVYFFAKDNHSPLFFKINELNKLIRAEPYNTAIDQVDFRRLKPMNKLTWMAAKTKSGFVLWSVYNAERVISKIHGRKKS